MAHARRRQRRIGERVRAACGCSTIARMDQLALLDESLVAVHAVYVDDEEADLLARER